MFKRFMLICSLVVSVVAVSGTQANAQFFDGWAWFGFSAVRGEIRTQGTPDPRTEPSQIMATVSADVQIACLTGTRVFIGRAFHRTITGVGAAGNTKIRPKGDAITTVFLSLDQFEVVKNCSNHNSMPDTAGFSARNSLTPVKDSAMALNFTGTVTWCRLDETGVPDCSDKGLLNQSNVTCVLDTTNPANQREPKTGKAPEGAIFTCSEPQNETKSERG